MPEIWETWTGSFPLEDYNFAPTDQLSRQPQPWQVADIHLQSENPDQDLSGNLNEDLHDYSDYSSADEGTFAMETHTETGGVADEDNEDIDEEHVEHVHPTASYGLPLLSELPSDFQPLNGENHTRQ